MPGTTIQPAAYTPQAAGAQQRTEDRSIITAGGGAAVLGSNASIEKLPAETSAFTLFLFFFLSDQRMLKPLSETL
jgi:hypothetical protein